MTSYQQRKKEIRELKSTIFQLEKKLNEHGIEFGQLTIDDKYVPTNILLSPEDMEKFQGHRNPSKPPPPPPPRKFKEGINFHQAFSKLWKWLKYWLTPIEPYERDMIERTFITNQPIEIIQFQENKYLKRQGAEEKSVIQFQLQ